MVLPGFDQGGIDSYGRSTWYRAADTHRQLIFLYTLGNNRPTAACRHGAQYQVQTGEWILSRPKGRHALAAYVNNYSRASDAQDKLEIARQYTSTHHAIWSLDVLHTSGAVHDQWWIQEQHVRDLGKVAIALPADLRQSLPFTAYVRPPMTREEVLSTRFAHFLFVRQTPEDIVAHDEDYALQMVRTEDGGVSYRALLMAPTDEDQVSYRWSGQAEMYPQILRTFRRWSAAMRKLNYRAVYMINANDLIAEHRSGGSEQRTYALLQRRRGRWQVAEDFGSAFSREAGIAAGMRRWQSRDETA